MRAVVAAPLAWLAVALAGFVLVCAGVIVDIYRHEHGADAGALIGLSNPGVLIAMAGLLTLAVGILIAVAMLALSTAASADAVIMRGAAVAAAWVAVAGAAAGALAYAATTDVTIGHDRHAPAVARPTTPVAGRTAGAPPGVEDRVLLQGTLTLDGAPLEAQFLGVRVQHDGLAAACQHAIPTVSEGRYEISVLADSETRGCGAPGAEIVLWTYANDTFVFSRGTLPWPGDGVVATFDATFASGSPSGASKPVTEFKGELLDEGGSSLPAGTVVEAYAGETRCGVTSLRYGDATDMLYTLIVAGPDAVSACTEGAALRFTIDGAAAAETAVNDLGAGARGHELNLTKR